MQAINDDFSLGHYTAMAKKHERITAEEELALIERWRHSQDQAALDRLVKSHQRLIVKMVSQMKGYRASVPDLMSEANAGFIKGIEKFDPTMGCRLSTIARWSIRAALQDYIIRYSSIVRFVTTSNHKRLFFGLRSTKTRLGIHSDENLTRSDIEKLTAEFSVTEADLLRINSSLAGSNLSLNVPTFQEAGDGDQLQDLLASEDPTPFELLARQNAANDQGTLVASALQSLNDRERHIIHERHLVEQTATLEELGNHFGVTRERIRQIEVQAFKKMKRHIEAVSSIDPVQLLAA